MSRLTAVADFSANSRRPRHFMSRIHTRIVGLCLPLLLVAVAGCNPTDPPPPADPSPTALDQPGSYKFSTYDTSFETSHGNNRATVYYPATSEGADTPPNVSGAPYPIVAVSPGLGSTKQWNRWIGEHLSTHGYIVMIITVPNPANSTTVQQQDGLLGALDKLTSENALSSSRIFNLGDASKRSIIGHSLGAMGALAVAGRPEVDLSAVIALAPGPVDADALKAITAPTQIQAAELDCIVRPKPSFTAYDTVGAAFKQVFQITGGNHVGFNDEGSVAEIGGDVLIDCNNTVDVTDFQQRLSRRFMTAWLDYFVKGDASVLPYISGAKAQAEVTAGRITKLSTQGL